ncbi:MAG: hypothetical protein P1V97_28100 [Planctomycetota bacterium]|nr:hypothetical protein [Planctomycetota bacterium]
MKAKGDLELEELIWSPCSLSVEQLREISLYVLTRIENQFNATVKYRENFVTDDDGSLFAIRMDSTQSMIPMHWEGLLMVRPNGQALNIYVEALAFILGNRCSPSDSRHGSYVTSWYEKKGSVGEWDSPSWSVDANGEWDSYRFEGSLF